MMVLNGLINKIIRSADTHSSSLIMNNQTFRTRPCSYGCRTLSFFNNVPYATRLKPSLRLKTQPYISRPATDCSCRLHLGGNKSQKLEPITKRSQPRVALARHQRSCDLFCRLAGKKQSATEWKTAVTRTTSGGRQGISGIGVAAPHDLSKIGALKMKQN